MIGEYHGLAGWLEVKSKTLIQWRYTMFVVQPKNAYDYQVATALLSSFDVYVKMDIGRTTTIVVTERSDYNALRDCEMAFQASFHQVGNLCPVCRAEIERTGEGSSVCGHLTFTTTI
jgi:hypothetical protein